eukprot:TRINITY_DN5928_c0_g1_i1.p1 TRINITY_DN5928_c0_g1~~TRINITY_DN5928_c0_g1_i1.p1  ORF type:complete len:565 (-),score=45.42 TRINITY_DN5928_c0_g1_i1:298-1992(-)
MKTMLEDYDMKNLKKIVTNELKVFPSSDPFYNVISKLWEEPKGVNLFPSKIYIRRMALWRLNLFFFLIFLGILTYYVFAIDSRQHRLFFDSINSIIEPFDSVTDFSSYTDWFHSSFIPEMYSSDDDHLYMLTDEILIRQIRIDPGSCHNSKNVPLPNVPLCYPREANTLTWTPIEKSWNNFTLQSIGKSILSTDYAVYGPEGFTFVLSQNSTEAQKTLSQINFDTWLDWSIQAMIIEFALYSPNLELFSVCTIIGEFTNAGQFKGYHECALVSPGQLALSYSWSAVFLYIFLSGFLVEELYELVMILIEFRPRTKSEKKEAIESWTCCVRERVSKPKSVPQAEEESAAVDEGENEGPDADDSEDDRCCAGCYSSKDYSCCCTTSCYTYSTDLWNGLDFLMIFSGFVGLILCKSAYQSLNTFTLDELWQVAYVEQLSRFFISFCVIITYFRFLHFLISLEYVGVLVITVFKMLETVLRFGIIMVIIMLGFSSGFHLLYDNLAMYSTFTDSSLSTIISILSGYAIPDYTNFGFSNCYRWSHWTDSMCDCWSCSIAQFLDCNDELCL